MRHQRWIRTGCRIAAMKVPYPHYKMVALVVCGGRLISYFSNKATFADSKNCNYKDRHIHAELDLFNNLDKKYIKKSIVYICGVSVTKFKYPAHNPRMLLSKPCNICQQLLKSLPFKGIYYHDQNGSVLKL